MSEDRLGRLLGWVAQARYESLPREAIEAAKACLLNTVAAMLGGSGAPGAREVVHQVRHWEGRAECTVAVHGFKAPAPFAALANGVMAHAMDFDDTQVGTGFHPNVSLLPALFAALETAPVASGRDLLLAHVTGLEIGCRMTLAATHRAAHPWLTSTLFGVFGAAIAAGKVARLDERLLRHAVGIVYSSAGGNRQGLLDGAHMQRVQPGLCAQAAVTAVSLASAGVTGAHDVLEGHYGLYPSYYGADYEPEALVRDLGREFRMLELALKPFPCCSYAQEPIEAALRLAGEHPFRPDEIAEVRASVGSAHAARLVDRPYRAGSWAQVDAQFSMQYLLAAALSRRSLGLAELQEDALLDPALADLAGRVVVAVDPQSEGTVAMRFTNGGEASLRVPVAPGHPSRPFDESRLFAKLKDCAAHAAVPRSAAQAASIAEAVRRLDACERGADLLALLA
jgi:2-methylcitrate dehydratase PrpD